MTIIKTKRLKEGQYIEEKIEKKQLFLHHTVGGSALSTIYYWNSNKDRIGTADIVDRDGTIYEVFNPIYWCYHLGLKKKKNKQYNQESHGIEIASEGALRSGYELNKMLKKAGEKEKFDEEWLYAFDVDPKRDKSGMLLPAYLWFSRAKKLYHVIIDKDKFMDFPAPLGPFRGYTYFDSYESIQVEAVNWLINFRCETLGIKKQIIPGDKKFRFEPKLLDTFEGVLAHCNVRKDKSDVCPAWDWNETKTVLEL